MIRLTAGLAILFLVGCVVGNVEAARIYEFEQFPNLDRVGWSFAGGTVKLSDFEGELNSDNFASPGVGSSIVEDFSIVFSSPFNGGTTYQLTPANAVVAYSDATGIPNYKVDSSTISHPGPGSPGGSTYEILHFAAAEQRVQFYITTGEAFLNLHDDGQIGQPGGMNTNGRVPLPFVVARAVVPEPKSMLLVLVPLLGLVARVRTLK